MAAMVLGLPLLLVLRPESLLTGPDQEMLRDWLHGVRQRNRRLLDRVRAHEAQLERDFERTVASSIR